MEVYEDLLSSWIKSRLQKRVINISKKPDSNGPKKFRGKLK